MQSSYDVVIIGAGMAGHAAAIAAAEAGASVLMAEKCEEFGGSSLYSGATFAFADTQLQRQQGIDDSTATFRADLLDVGGHKNDPELIEAYLDHQLETFDWLIGLGVSFSEVQLSSNMSVPRSHPALPRQILDLAHVRALELGVDYQANIAAKRVETASGLRILFAKDGRSVWCDVAKGIVIATGGFARSKTLVEDFAPSQAAAMRLGGKGSTGDGIEIALGIGGEVADMEFVTATFGVPLIDYPEPQKNDIEGAPPLVHAMYRGAILVNETGKRFTNEAQSYKVLGDICLSQPNATAFQILDTKIFEQAVELPRTHNYKKALAEGYLRKADTIEELAGTVGLDPQVLAETVETYNRDARAGRDTQFGRTTLGKNVGTIVPIDAGPFYIMPSTAVLFSTYAGVKVDRDMRLVDAQGLVLPGMYAAGEVIGGFHGKGYMSGTGMGKAAVFGRLAGRNAAKSHIQ
ncbi:MAG: FAD-binding protein [Pelagibacterium sp.]|uniref:FAD-dependent oxidoreductase n=1 Tax=Pelagibacterium sp. TaxID=1967288 RepID=UPI0032EDF487